jgi:hypothetical protein
MKTPRKNLRSHVNLTQTNHENVTEFYSTDSARSAYVLIYENQVHTNTVKKFSSVLSAKVIGTIYFQHIRLSSLKVDLKPTVFFQPMKLPPLIFPKDK